MQNEINTKNFILRVIGIGSLALFSVSVVLFFLSISRQQTIPVLVNVMPSGEAVYLGEVRQSGGVQVSEASIVYQVREFITNIRSVSVDPHVMNVNLTKCFYASSRSFEPILTRIIRDQDLFSLVGKMRRLVEIETTLHITGTSYQVDWTEITIEPGGTQRSRKMRGLLTVLTIPPQPEFIKTNPLGIFIEAFEWTEL